MRAALALYAVVALASCTNLTYDGGDATPDRIAITPDSVTMERNGHASLEATYVFGDRTVAATDVTWTSSAPGVATIAATADKAMVTAVAPGTTTISVAGSGITAMVEITINTPSVVSLVVDPFQPTMPAGRDVMLTATATMSDDTTMVVTNQATWTSAKTNVATVTAGLIHGVAIGESYVTANFGGAFSTTRATVTAAVVTSIEVTPANQLVAKGTPVQFTATGTFSNGTMSNITTTVTWSSNNAAVTISNAAGTKGLAATPNQGTATITATSGTVFGTTTLQVAPAALSSITISPVTASLTTVAKSADVQFTATAQFTDGSSSDVTAQATWSSTMTGVATISNAGLADALTLGTTTIGASVTLGLVTKTDSETMTIVLPAVGSYTADANFSGTPCDVDAVKFSLVDSGSNEAAYVCMATAGVMKGTVTTSVAWAAANDTIDNLNGSAIATHRQNAASAGAVVYMAKPAASIGNWFFTSNGGTSWAGVTLTAGTFGGAANPVLDTASNPRWMYAARFQQTVGNMIATWDPTPQAVILTQQGTNASSTRNLGSATGTTRGLAGNNTVANGLLAVVLGETPNGTTAGITGGIFISTAIATWTQSNSGIVAPDLNNLTSIVSLDPTNASVASGTTGATHLVGVRGGARIYRTTDNAATWTPTGTGIPSKAQVRSLYVPPGQTANVYAATDIGLYKSTDGGVNWALDGFQGRAIKGIGQSAKTSSIIIVAIEPGSGDSPLYLHN